VIKVEKPRGESMRRGIPEGIPWPEEADAGVDDAPWMAFNQGKRAIAVDLKDPRGRELVERLIATADVFMHNFRPKAIAKMGLDHASVESIRPAIVYLDLFAYGGSGPLANWAGGDAWIQGFSGIVSLQGSQSGPPYLAGPGVADLSGAFWGAIAVLAGLIARERAGIGQGLQTSLLGAAMFLQLAEYTDYLVDGRLNKKSGRGYRGAFPYGAYRAKDGDVVTFYGAEESWPALLSVLGLERLLEDERYATQRQREQLKDELYPVLDEAFSQRTRAEWQALFRQAGLRVDPALDHAEVVAHPQTEANRAIVEIPHPVRGRIRMLSIPIAMSRMPLRTPLPPPLLGEHSAEIAGELGYSEGEIGRLAEAGVLRLGGDR
jgi:crotonobetainyl-CoA:carnitine CoA-transferase CaiB-like acyl-CoA transferase